MIQHVVLIGLIAAAGLSTGPLAVAIPPPAPEAPVAETIVHFDLASIGDNIGIPSGRRAYYDRTHLVAALQGLVNRDRARLFVRHRGLTDADDFWWNEMTEYGGWLSNRAVNNTGSLDYVLSIFRDEYTGAVVWDERVPATSNVASTIAGVENLLPLRYDPSPGSLYHQLVIEGGLPVQRRLLADNGDPLFTGSGLIEGTTRESSGSAKCDAYLWLIEHYIKTGLVNPLFVGYYLDAYWLQTGYSNQSTLTNHDFIIARGGCVFDLHMWHDEAPIDDPGQPEGTDYETLHALFSALHEQAGPDEFIHVCGFVPWNFKYTTYGGGRHQAVATEWRCVEIVSCYNAFLDADAAGINDMGNASFFQHYPLASHYPQNPKPTVDDLIDRGLLNADGSFAKHRFVAHYVGDYDSAAWLYRKMPSIYNDPARGRVDLSWAFNPNLAVRFPLGMAWLRSNRSPRDFFVAGDSGAGYINPGHLTEYRHFSGLPSGVNAWEAHCAAFFEQWDISLTGFVIDGFAPQMDEETLDAYARFSPDGIVPQKGIVQGLYNDMPVLRMGFDLTGSPSYEAGRVVGALRGEPPRFLVVRSILRSPSWYEDVNEEIERQSDGDVVPVDLYTLMRLLKHYETMRNEWTPTPTLSPTITHTPRPRTATPTPRPPFEGISLE